MSAQIDNTRLAARLLSYSLDVATLKATGERRCFLARCQSAAASMPLVHTAPTRSARNGVPVCNIGDNSK